jgi:hypothetical protein
MDFAQQRLSIRNMLDDIDAGHKVKGFIEVPQLSAVLHGVVDAGLVAIELLREVNVDLIEIAGLESSAVTLDRAIVVPFTRAKIQPPSDRGPVEEPEHLLNELKPGAVSREQKLEIHLHNAPAKGSKRYRFRFVRFKNVVFKQALRNTSGGVRPSSGAATIALARKCFQPRTAAIPQGSPKGESQVLARELAPTSLATHSNCKAIRRVRARGLQYAS